MNTSMIPSWLLGLIRGLGTTILVAVFGYLGNAANLSPFMSATTASALASLVLMLEHVVEAKTGTALFGMVRTKNV